MKQIARRYPLLFILPVLFLIWQITAGYGLVGKSLLANPKEVIEVLLQGFYPSSGGQAIYAHALETIARALSGWSLSLIIGLILGTILGISSLTYRSSEPILEFIRAIPPIMFFPLFLVAFDFGSPAYIWTITIGCLPIMTLSVSRGIQNLDYSRLELLKVHDVASSIRTLASVIEILPSALFGARLTLSLSLIISVVTEMVFSPKTGYALGALAKDSQISFETAKFYACILILGTFGYFMNAIIRQIEWWLTGEFRQAN
ncbi:ABC transporter permease [Synechococcus elongatus]|uniref:ABC transporter permease n=1 Tax=Synechococcus elongatus TaxID=32046 RepID=UPI0030CAFAA9